MKLLSFFIAGILIFNSCKKDEKAFDTSLFKDYYYINLTYRNPATKDTVDTTRFYFNSDDTLKIIKYNYDVVNGKIALKGIAVQLMIYQIVNNNRIYMLFAYADYWQTIVSNLTLYPEWRLNKLDKTKLSLDFYDNVKRGSAVFYAVKR